MDILKLMEERHSVREYLDKSIEEDKKEILNAYIEKVNKEYDTNVQIFYDDERCFKNASASYGNFSGCKNLIALVGKDEEKCGYVGQLIVLKAQEIGLNTCFVFLTYERSYVKGLVKVNKGEKIYCSIALGYGKTNGHERKSKSEEQVLKLIGDRPEYLDEVVKAALLAPTAINQQKFKIICENGEISIKKTHPGVCLDTDLGIVKCNVDLILNKYNKKVK